MFLSKIVLDNHNRNVLRDLSSPYQMHRTIMSAFPDKLDGGPGKVLFRTEEYRADRYPVVLVQSEKRPDWQKLNNNYLDQQPQIKSINLPLLPNQLLRFKIRANPTVKHNGKRCPLFREDDQKNWLENKGKKGGFLPVDFYVYRAQRNVSPPSPPDKPYSQVHFSVDYEGVLKVTQAQRFLETIADGIGPGKAYGFGLLSIAKLR